MKSLRLFIEQPDGARFAVKYFNYRGKSPRKSLLYIVDLKKLFHYAVYRAVAFDITVFHIYLLVINIHFILPLYTL